MKGLNTEMFPAIARERCSAEGTRAGGGTGGAAGDGSHLWDPLYEGKGIKQDENKWDSWLRAGGTVPAGAEQGCIYGLGTWGLFAELQPLPIDLQEGKCFPAPVTTPDSNGILLS